LDWTTNREHAPLPVVGYIPTTRCYAARSGAFSWPLLAYIELAAAWPEWRCPPHAASPLVVVPSQTKLIAAWEQEGQATHNKVAHSNSCWRLKYYSLDTCCPPTYSHWPHQFRWPRGPRLVAHTAARAED
ncbi:hypothetical protein Dimus_033565, partial [Dionaea muscipula]